MPTGSDYPIAVVLINRHEPEGEVAGRLLEIATEKDYDPRVVEAVRGDHDAALSFRVPQDVAEAFNDDRSDRWPDKIENDDERASGEHVIAAVDGDAYAADGRRVAKDTAVTNANDGAEATPVGNPAQPGATQDTPVGDTATGPVESTTKTTTTQDRSTRSKAK
jgi:hypothetical protein